MEAMQAIRQCKMPIIKIPGFNGVYPILKISPSHTFPSVGQLLRFYEDELRRDIAEISGQFKIEWNVAATFSNGEQSKVIVISNRRRRYSPGFLMKGAGKLDDKIDKMRESMGSVVERIIDMNLIFI